MSAPLRFFLVPVLAFLCVSPALAENKNAGADGQHSGGPKGWGAYRITDVAAEPALPRVLLVGDSIANGYHAEVAKRLQGRANVDLYITPLHVAAPDYRAGLAKALTYGKYAVIHYNESGLHAWVKGRVPEGRYGPLFAEAVGVLRRGSPGARLIWASNTPATVQNKPGVLDEEVDRTIADMNAAALPVAIREGMAIDDLHALMAGKLALAAGDRWHWTAKGVVVQAEAVTSSILAELAKAAPHASVWTPDNGDGTFKNPMMWGDWPDPDILRVGDDFYFSSTSMQYVPGCPVAKSKDLVNWEMAGYAVERYTEDPRWNFQGAAMYLNGSWATTLRYRDGLFYLGFCTPDTYGGVTGHDSHIAKGHFSMCVAKDPAGPWKRVIFPEYMYDPGLLFDDDGKVYVAHGQGTILVSELNADALSVKTPEKVVFPARRDYPYLEGSHFYKIDGRYYILGSTGGHTGRQICLRADNPYGPYESRQVCKDDASYPSAYLHQGGMVQLKNGDWWFVIMQGRESVGRVPMLTPVKWVDGWPMLGEKGDGKGVVIAKKPDVGGVFPVAVPATSDRFDSPVLGLQWQWNHNPDDAAWSLAERPGFLRLRAGRATNLWMARNTLTQRVQGPACTGTVALDVRGLKDGSVAGLGIFEAPYAYVAVKQEGAVRRIVRVAGKGKSADAASEKELASVPGFSGDRLWIRATVKPEDGGTAELSYSIDGKTFLPLGGVFKMGLGLSWTANRFALFHFTTKDGGAGAAADFDNFEFSGDNPETPPIPAKTLGKK